MWVNAELQHQTKEEQLQASATVKGAQQIALVNQSNALRLAAGGSLLPSH
jgi:hypothetical protein